MRKFSRSRVFVSNAKRAAEFKASLTGRYTLIETSYKGCFQIYDAKQLQYIKGTFSKEAGERKLAELRAEKPNTPKPSEFRVLPDVTELSDDDLIALVKAVNVETHRRAVEIDLPAAARRAIEESVIDPYDQFLDDRFDAQFYATAY